MENRIFVVEKPVFISSNGYLRKIKRKYNVKKAGFSGTLDPFAKGTLIIAFGQYTKLFQFLKKTKKTYKATLWLGAESDSLDIENFQGSTEIPKFDLKNIQETLNSMVGKIEYIPPKYSAKSINGERAYKLAREGKEVKLKSINSEIFQIKLLNYSHPFLSFEIEVSEGSYIRSFGEIIAKKLGTTGVLSSLNRIAEGDFKFENEKKLNPLELLSVPENRYLGEIENIELGRKLKRYDFENQEIGKYLIILEKSFSIIQISDEKVSYLLNKVQLLT